MSGMVLSMARRSRTRCYIDRKELTTKREMCAELGVRPLLIMRMAAKSYVERIRQAGGFALLFGWQLYPYGHQALAKRVREELGLPVDSPKAVWDGTVKRFLDWHVRGVRQDQPTGE